MTKCQQLLNFNEENMGAFYGIIIFVFIIFKFIKMWQKAIHSGY